MPSVLFVCTENLCRSPTAAAFLAQRLETVAPDVVVTSSGVQASGKAALRNVVEAARPYGVDLEGHRPRQLEASQVEGADLVIGMAREHVREIILLDTASFSRTFTLRELVRRSVGPRGPDTSLDAWLELAHRGRRHLDLLGDSRDDDVEDPIGGPPEAYQSMAREISGLIDAVTAALWPPVP
jgi:protein-tyrosine phosphatase